MQPTSYKGYCQPINIPKLGSYNAKLSFLVFCTLMNIALDQINLLWLFFKIATQMRYSHSSLYDSLLTFDYAYLTPINSFVLHVQTILYQRHHPKR
jgi:hypothetical protein